MKKVISRIRGGLGNQLFCYAAARRLALRNNAELVLDDSSGFKRDGLYRRKYMLDYFNIAGRKATPAERLEPFERYRRAWWKFLSRLKRFQDRSYLEQVGNDFDARLLEKKVHSVIYADGLWQSEEYFKDIEMIIRDDLRIKQSIGMLNDNVSELIRKKESVAVHVRWFDSPGIAEKHNVNSSYYQRSISIIENKLTNAHYFVFSDNPEAVYSKINLPKDKYTLITHNKKEDNAYHDLWLMSQCKHFITANSTFSWWGAWLGSGNSRIILTPDINIKGITSWGFKGLIPQGWIKV